MHTFCTIYTVSAIYAFMTSLSFAKVISIIPCLFKISVHFLCFSVFIACRDVMYVTSSAFGENLARHKTSIKNRQQNHWISHSPFRPVTEDLVTLCTFYVALGHWVLQAIKPCWNYSQFSNPTHTYYTLYNLICLRSFTYFFSLPHGVLLQELWDHGVSEEIVAHNCHTFFAPSHNSLNTLRLRQNGHHFADDIF